MTSASGLQRFGLGAAAVLVVGIAALVLMPLLIPAAMVRDAVQAEIRAAIGLSPVMRGEATVSLFPSARVTFTDVILGEERSGAPALAAEQLTAQLKLLPLLFRRIEIADIALTRPHISVTFGSDGRSNWSGLIETLLRTLQPGAHRSGEVLSFSEIRIDDGIVVLSDETRGLSETVTEMALSVAWPSISRSFGATGRFVWRDEPVEASISVNDLFAALTGDRSGIKVRLAGPPLKIAFDGQMTRQPNLRVEGTLAADSPSLREALRWAGHPALPGGGFGAFALRAQASMAGATASFSNVNLELDGNTAEGVLTLTHDGRLSLQGTLAAEELDLAPYFSTVRLMRQNEREWDRVPISLDGFAGLDADLRLSAARVGLLTAKLGRTALAATLRDGRMALTIGDSQAFGGSLKGVIGLGKSDNGADLKVQLQFTDVDLEGCLGEVFGIRRLEGRGDLALALEGAGGSVLALTRTLHGQANLSARKGALAGVNVEQWLRRLESRPLSGGTEFRGGRTPFDKLNIAVKIAQGTATVEVVHVEGAAVTLAVIGSASIPARDLDLSGTASLLNSAAPFQLPFFVKGPWDDPLMLPDPDVLVQRSTATAPLLDALKDRKARDAIRSGIEQLSRGGRPAAAPTAGPAATLPAATAAQPSALPPTSGPAAPR